MHLLSLPSFTEPVTVMIFMTTYLGVLTGTLTMAIPDLVTSTTSNLTEAAGLTLALFTGLLFFVAGGATPPPIAPGGMRTC